LLLPALSPEVLLLIYSSSSCKQNGFDLPVSVARASLALVSVAEKGEVEVPVSVAVDVDVDLASS